MPETDFDQIAQPMADALYVTDVDGTRPRTDGPTIIMTREWYIEQLRQVWNARGAADAEAVEHRLATLTGWVTSEPYRQHLREAIEALNR